MNEKDLNKKLSSEVKPGTESIAINEAQSQANSLMTEQRMNLESEKQIVTSNAERDLELRGAIELGAMGGSGQPVRQVALPPQSAGLRPETQELLSRYGVNPRITESSRSNSNSTQSRSSTSNRQFYRSGDSRVTNTTNITNITNNNTRNETDVDISNSGSSPKQMVPVSLPQQDNTSKFKIYMNNLFSKRDQERRMQEKEFRKREWSIKRMTDKILNRMEKISDSFSKRMNPENLGRTFGSQMKLLLGAVGITLIPKIWPKLVSGVDKIGEWIGDIKSTFNGTNGTFFEKIGVTLAKVGTQVAGGIIGAISAASEEISIRLGRLLGGEGYENSSKGLFQVAAEKIASFLSGKDVKFDEGNWKSEFGDSMKEYLGQIRDDFKDILNVMMEERSEAVKEASSKISGWDILSPSEAIGKLIDVIGAAIGGHSYLANSAMSKATKKSNEDLQKGSKDGDFTYWGNIKSEHGTRVVSKNLAKAALDDENSNSVTMSEGLKKLYKYGSDVETGGILMRESEVKSIISRMSAGNKEDMDRMIDAINYGIKNNAIKRIQDDVYTNTGDFLLRIPPESVPTFIGILSNIPGVPMNFSMNNISSNNSFMKGFYSDKDLYRRYQENLDKMITDNTSGSFDWRKAINPLHWGNELGKFIYNSASIGGSLWDTVSYDFDLWKTAQEKSSLEQFGYNKYKEKSNSYNEDLSELYNKLKHDSGADRVNLPKVRMPSMPDISKDDAKTWYHDSKDSSSEYVRELFNNPSAKIKPLLTGAKSIARNSSDYVLYKAPLDSNGIAEASSSKVPSVILPEYQNEWMDKNSDMSIDLGGKMTQDNFNSRVRRAMSVLISSFGLTPTQASGIVGNLIRESRMVTSAFNPAGGGTGARGLAQWRGGRSDAFRKKFGHDILEGTFEEHLQFMIDELGSTHKTAINELKSVKDGDTNSAADIGLGRFEFSSGVDDAVRELGEHGLSSQIAGRNFAKYALDTYLSQGPYDTPIKASDKSSVDTYGFNLPTYSSSSEGLSTSGGIQGTVESIWGMISSGFNELFGSNDSATSSVPNEISKYTKGDTNEVDSSIAISSTSDSSVIPSAIHEPSIDYEQIDKYIEDKESEISEDELGTGLTNIETGGNTNITNSGNTTIINYNSNGDSRESFLEVKSRSYRRN
jgi:hypothetical protein